ncbi:PREDICTED: formin-binding protein 4-like [Dufourea novaeangliae]|uniref:formin-binding protein 4-like n=1 Tax=Dufourea novaeangliae TaxID=178035 RepID=UPI0007672366|nr:PREDICTED: formin-binding protein 4-like [Dufourea novaeangliae]
MKRRQRRPVLELNEMQAGSHGGHVQNKRKQPTNDYPGQNVPANSLANLLCHYNSDSDTEDTKKDVRKLDDQVNNFLKEIQLIAPKQLMSNEFNNSALTANSNTQLPHHVNQQESMWRECIDESSGYPYYWHIETNQVTWEMPEELRYMKNNMKPSSVVNPHSIQDPHWVDFSSAGCNYTSDRSLSSVSSPFKLPGKSKKNFLDQSHENIPEGMIPREVVARNRNRYNITNETAKKQEPPVDQDVTSMSDTMDNESDDGKIEMITSYGSEESDSDTADESHSKNEAPAVSAAESTNPNSTNKSKTEGFPSSIPTRHSQMLKTSQNLDQDSKDSMENPKAETLLDPKPSEEKEVKYLKSQVRLQESEESSDRLCSDSRTVNESKLIVMNENSKSNLSSDLDFRVSLVPGYDEDSDVEDEPEVKQERKALFPIPQTEDTMESLSSKVHCVPDTSDSDVNIERRNVPELDSEVILEKAESGEESISKSEDDGQRANKFLDNLHGRSKFFQRKKRIAFDVPSAKKKITDAGEVAKPEAEPQQEESSTCDSVEHHDEGCRVAQEEQSNVITEDKGEDVPSLSVEPKDIDEEAVTPSESTGDSKEEEAEVTLLSQIILEKLKFLSEGKPTVSPVQMMSIQLQTLFVAWEGGYLEKSYLRRWLTDTSHELERLEQDAAPPGWLCQWDRSHKRYYYQNTATGVTQWTYPDTGIAGGAEEMEICSTPPPMEQESRILPATEEDGLKPKPKKLQEVGDPEDVTAPRNSDGEAPPPPQISNPSPPPPPRLYANDMKKDKRKRDKGCDAADSKKQRLEDGTVIAEVNNLENHSIASHSAVSLSPQTTTLASIAGVASVTNVSNVEPLPPGVDLTEAPYELPATALKRIIYGAVQPQGGALYDATARDPTVPILSHPAAIVQEHYLQYPAYQHLHSPAALVLPHKHGVQPAIQLIPDYTPIYTNHKVIEKPPMKTAKESLVSALDSFYSDIARIENSRTEIVPQRPDTSVAEAAALPVEETKVDMELETLPVEATLKEKKKKKARVGISKKHKEVSSMVAKWQKVQQNFENT